MRRDSFNVTLSVLFVGALIGLTGCEDGNLFGRFSDRGSSSDPEVLVAQGQVALREKDYGAALSIYEKALQIDDDNAKALYGASAAAVGSSGLNIGNLVSNIYQQVNSASAINNIGDLIAQSRERISPQGPADSLLEGIDLDSLDGVIDTAICRLQRIVSGGADGSIAAGDIDVLLNLGSLCVIRAVLRPLQKNLLDIQNVNGSYTVVSQVDLAAGMCATPPTVAASGLTEQETQDLMIQIIKDVVATYALFNRAVNILNLGSDKIIRQLRDDINTAAQELLTAGAVSNFPAECVTLFSANGITLANFTSNTDVFDSQFPGCNN